MGAPEAPVLLAARAGTVAVVARAGRQACSVLPEPEALLALAEMAERAEPEAVAATELVGVPATSMRSVEREDQVVLAAAVALAARAAMQVRLEPVAEAV